MSAFYIHIVVSLLLIFYGKRASSAHEDYKLYEPINKENIRNSLKDSDLKVVDGAVNEDINKVLKNVSEILLPNFLKVNIEDENVLKLHFNFSKDELKSVGRKISSKMGNVMQYMLVPGFLMAGILPWVMPKLQMAVMVVSMLNNMVFSSALFSLVRSYVFEQEPDDHVIYVNHGYRDHEQHHQYVGPYT